MHCTGLVFYTVNVWSLVAAAWGNSAVEYHGNSWEFHSAEERTSRLLSLGLNLSRVIGLIFCVKLLVPQSPIYAEL